MTTPAPSVDGQVGRSVVTFVNPIVIVIGLSVIAAGVGTAFGHPWFAAWFLLGGLLSVLNAKLAVLKVATVTAEKTTVRPARSTVRPVASTTS